MSSPPLQLEQYFYSRVVFEANPEYKPGEKTKSVRLKETPVTLLRHTEDIRRWQVILDIGTPSLKELSGPYYLEVQVVGFFRVTPDFPEENIGILLGVTGASILYSAAREFILLVTSRGPWPALSLPTVTFAKEPKSEPIPSPKTRRRKVAAPV